MARQSALKNESESKTQTPAQAEKPEYTKEQLKGMLLTLQATEKAIADEFGAIAHSEYSIGKSLITIRDQKLFLAAKDPAKDFSAYLEAKATEWRTTRMSLYNYINLASLPQKTAEKVGLTVAAKLGALAKVDEKAAEKATEKAVEAIDSGKGRSGALAKVVDIATKAREKAGVNRAPGRNGEQGKVDKATATEKNEKLVGKDPAKISDKDRAVVDWGKVTDAQAAGSGWTKEAVVEVGGLRLRIRSMSARVDVKVLASK